VRQKSADDVPIHDVKEREQWLEQIKNICRESQGA
jgi:hypothetical protein